MNTEIFYKIRTELADGRYEEIEFENEYNLEGECVDAYSYNPTSGWTNYNNFDQGWSEQDPELQELLNAIKDYSNSMECEQMIAETNKNDIGNTYTIEHYCDMNVTENKTYTFIVTIQDITYTGDVIDSLNEKQIELVKEEIEKQYECKVDEDDFREYLDLSIVDAEQIIEFNTNNWGFLKQGILEDYSKCI